AIKRDPAFAGTILLMLSSLGRRPGDDTGLFARWLTKPVRSSVLMDALAQAWGGGVPATPPVAGPEEEPPPARESGGNVRALLVEDNGMNQVVAQKMLAK